MTALELTVSEALWEQRQLASAESGSSVPALEVRGSTLVLSEGE